MSNQDTTLYEAQKSLVDEVINVDDQFVVVENTKWNGNICDCFNNIYPSMFCSFITPNIYLSLMYRELTKKKYAFSTSLLTYVFLNLSAILLHPYSKLISKILFLSSSIYTMCLILYVRNKIRIKNNIPGSECEDVLLSLFCTPCSISQSGRTLYEYDKICDSL